MLVHSFMPPFFFFNDPATTEIYPLSLHDALPIWTSCSTSSPTTRCSRRTTWPRSRCRIPDSPPRAPVFPSSTRRHPKDSRSEEHTSELQSLRHLVCRLLLEKKKQQTTRECKTKLT